MKRLFSLILLVAILLGSTSKVWARAQTSSLTRPLVIVGRPKDSEKTISYLIEAAKKAGLSMGEDLFVLCPRDITRDIPLLASQLSSFISNCRIETGQDNLDVVAIGLSGFAVRYALETGRLSQSHVKNLVMISAPNRGSFAAEIMRAVYEIARQEGRLEESTRLGRYSPVGGLAETISAVVGDKLGHDYIEGVESTSLPPWENEVGWIEARSRSLYEPLYASYVKRRFFSVPYLPVQSPSLTFAGWIFATYPSLWRTLMDREKPPVSWTASADPWNQLPSEGQDFSTAYYEFLAMTVARNQYVMRMASKNDLVKRLFQDTYVPNDPTAALCYYGGKAASYYAEQMFITWKAKAQEKVTSVITDLLGLGSDPNAPIVRRLMKENILVNLGVSASQRYYRIPANVHLALSNSVASEKVSDRTTRYVNIGVFGKNPWQSIFPGIGPNAYGCEVDSAIAPVGPMDEIRVFGMGIGRDALEDKNLIKYVLESLEIKDYVVEVDSDSVRTIKVSSWKPAYLRSSKSEALDVLENQLDLPSPPEGWSYLIWRANRDLHPVESQPGILQGGGSISVMCQADELIGIRLVRTGTINPVLGGKVTSAYADEVKTELSASAKIISGHAKKPDQPPNNSHSKDIENDESGDESGVLDDQKSKDDGTSRKEGDEGWIWWREKVSDGDQNRKDVPTIRVVYRSKHTTLEKPKEISHKTWLIDYGDGQLDEIEGQPHLDIVHTYTSPGTYFVKMTSLDDQGETVLEKEMDVVCGGSPCDVRLTASSIVPPTVELKIVGPKKWVTGKEALYTAELKYRLPAGATLESCKIDPGETFKVLWERSGEFTVYCAAILKIRYQLDGGDIVVKNTYLESIPVEVFTLGLG